MRKLFTLIILSILPMIVSAENGYKLWLRYSPLDAAQKSAWAGYFSGYYTDEKSPLLDSATEELQLAVASLTGSEAVTLSQKQAAERGIVLGTTKNKVISKLKLGNELKTLGRDGYIVRTMGDRIIIAGNTDKGVMYGLYHLLREAQMNTNPATLDIVEKPLYDLRILNHWDNIDGSIERGYAGYSIWEWDRLPADVSTRYKDYARANASIGINATVLNNVNANPNFITPEYLEKVKIVADILRPYGITTYLSINFSSPVLLGGLETSDPMDPAVRLWWRDKAKEIYSYIPDFGGFLVKANSEGQPGPQDFGRTHVDGANMLAEALKPHNGIVMWRAFVYDPESDDRAKQAYEEFKRFDGQFHDNVIVQVKNGPIDFQPREPFTPLFGAMQKTPLMIEFQVTQEYLGHSVQLAYLAPMWEEVLKADTYALGEGSTVGRVTDGTLFPQKITAIAGVGNIGLDRNWTGHHFAQSNWYAFGRQAWNHELESDVIADEWIRMTFGNDGAFIEPVKEMMMSSREAIVDYMMPFGLHHIFAPGHHYGPGPWDVSAPRPDWTAVYYHKADAYGIGFDRTATGTNAVEQYFSPLREIYADVNICPENLLLFFHHVAWDHRMNSGRTLWEELCISYNRGVDAAREFQKTWDRMENMVDAERFAHVQDRLKQQTRDAIIWKDACQLYFQTFSARPIPYELDRPVHSLDELQAIRLPMGHTNAPFTGHEE